MNFDFSAEQEQLREQTRRLLSSGRAAARTLLETEVTHDKGLWAQVVEMGWPAAAIAEEHGGLGLSALELCVLAEEMGRSLAPIPFSSSVLYASEALKLVAESLGVGEVLQGLACGEHIGTVALAERGQVGWAEAPLARVVDGRLTGSKAQVSDATAATLAVVSARAEEDGDGFGWWLVDLHADGVSSTPTQCIDRIRRHADLTFDGVPVVRLGAPGAGAALSSQLMDVAAVLTAFEQLGSAETSLALTIEFVQTRQAFNRPVAAYQAVKHTLANMYVKNQLARSHCYYGAWALTQGPEALPRAAAGARLAATDALNFAAEESVELHGGIGFTWESDIQLFYRRSRLLATQLGGRADWARRLVLALASEVA